MYSSLTVDDTLLSVTSLEEAFQLSIHDDDVALEAPEAILLELSVYNQASCSLLNLTPFNQTQITILDNDGEDCRFCCMGKDCVSAFVCNVT